MKIRQHKQAKLNWVLACTILCTTHVNAQKKFTIADCINYAFQNNPLLNATHEAKNAFFFFASHRTRPTSGLRNFLL